MFKTVVRIRLLCVWEVTKWHMYVDEWYMYQLGVAVLRGGCNITVPFGHAYVFQRLDFTYQTSIKLVNNYVFVVIN